MEVGQLAQLKLPSGEMCVNLIKRMGKAALSLVKFLSILVAILAGIIVFSLIIVSNYTKLALSLVIAILISFILIWLTDYGLKKLDE